MNVRQSFSEYKSNVGMSSNTNNMYFQRKNSSPSPIRLKGLQKKYGNKKLDAGPLKSKSTDQSVDDESCELDQAKSTNQISHRTVEPLTERIMEENTNQTPTRTSNSRSLSANNRNRSARLSVKSR